MSLNTLLAVIVGFALIAVSILMATDQPMAFYSLSSITIVLGGTLAALFISYEFKVAKAALSLIIQAFTTHRDSVVSLKRYIGRLVQWAYILQKGGLQGLENEIGRDIRAEDPFLAYGADLVITGYTGTEVRQILNSALQTQYQKNNVKAEALKKMGGDAPAFGMLGTLIGLVIMLGNMGANPAAIGPSMAIALITTFYGIILARLFFIPIAVKMAARYDATSYKNAMQIEGLVLLAERKSPRYIQDKINAFAEFQEQFSIDRDIKSSTLSSLMAAPQQPQTAQTPPSEQGQ